MTAPADPRPSIYVLAGTNGAGKSSVAGAAFRARGTDYFNPDEATRRLGEANPGVPLEEVNSLAWNTGRRLLETAIARRLDHAFETTLGGNTISALLERASDAGLAVRVWFVGLDSPERHLARVRARVEKGGHDIPEDRIRERYISSRENLVRLLPKLAELRIYDNSAESDPASEAPRPFLVLHVSDGVIRYACDVNAVPEWAKPLFVAAFRQFTI
jgi:predicted ABC-type ATPase